MQMRGGNAYAWAMRMRGVALQGLRQIRRIFRRIFRRNFRRIFHSECAKLNREKTNQLGGLLLGPRPLRVLEHDVGCPVTYKSVRRWTTP